MPRPVDMPGIDRYQHGMRARYVCGCRCSDCTRANREYARKRAKDVIFHGKNDLVSASTVRKHLKMLSRKGVGRRAVQCACDVGATTLQEIRDGRKSMVRRSTAERILSVTSEAASDHAAISAMKTWQQLNELLRDGFTKAELTKRMGFKNPAIQFGRRRVLASTAAKVDRFYRTIMAGA